MCCLDSSPIDDAKGRRKNYMGPNEFQTPMLTAPCAECPKSCCWFMGQCFPWTGGCTQYALRSKALGGDLSRYTCFQGYYNCCCIKAGSCGERDCPQLCLFIEGCCFNCLAISATRSMVIDQYSLHMDPCDYRLIRINNCLQCLSCLCYIAAIIDPSFRECASIVDTIADLFYHIVSGCMTAQVAHEINYQNSISAAPQFYTPKEGLSGYPPQQQPQGYPQPQMHMQPQQQQMHMQPQQQQMHMQPQQQQMQQQGYPQMQQQGYPQMQQQGYPQQQQMQQQGYPQMQQQGYPQQQQGYANQQQAPGYSYPASNPPTRF